MTPDMTPSPDPLRAVAQDVVGQWMLDNDVRIIRRRGGPLVDLIHAALVKVREDTPLKVVDDSDSPINPNGEYKMTIKLIALVLVLGVSSSAYGMGAWDGLKEQGKVYETGPDHPPTGSAAAVSGHTLLAAANPVYQAATVGWQSAAHASWNEMQGMGFVGYGLVVGPWLESRTAPAKVGKFEHNGHVVTGEAAKWERDPDHLGWNRLVRYDTIGPGADKTREYFSAIDRIGS